MSIKVVLADDHKIMREGLHSLIEKEPNMDVVGEANNGRETVRLTELLKPDVLVLDITMPDLNGIDAAQRINRKNHHTKILCLSMHSERNFVLAMFRAGVAGYLLKDCAFEELVRAIHTVNSGKIYISPEIANYIVSESLILTSDKGSVYTILTPREREILQLIAEGKSTKQIAAHLHRSVKTIETHREQIMKKLNLRSIAELTKYAISEGLTSLEQ